MDPCRKPDVHQHRRAVFPILLSKEGVRLGLPVRSWSRRLLLCVLSCGVLGLLRCRTRCFPGDQSCTEHSVVFPTF